MQRMGFPLCLPGGHAEHDGRDDEQPRVLEGLQFVLCQVKDRIAATHAHGVSFPADESFSGIVQMTDEDLSSLRTAMRLAARFDGDADPFPEK